MKLKSFAKKYKIDIILVLALFFLAFGIRAMPSDQFPNIYGFDSYFAAKYAKNIINDGYIWPYNDTTTLYPYGRMSDTPSDFGWWALEAGTYKVAALFSGAPGFDYNLFGQVASWLNAIVGSLAIPAVYLFGRAAWNRYVGLGGALFLAVAGNHLFYSIFGHAENDGLGFTLFFLALFAFVYTVRSRDWRIGLLATIMFGWLSNVWQVFWFALLLVSVTVVAYFIIYSILNQIGYYKNSENRDKERRWMIYALVFVLASILIHFPLGKQYTPLIMGAVGFSIVLCSLIEAYVNKIKINKQGISENPLLQAMMIGVVSLLVGSMLFGTSIITSPLSFAGINIGAAPAEITDYHSRLQTTIAEQNPIAGDDFLSRLDTLSRSGSGITVWFALGAILLIFAKLSIMPFIRKDFTWQWDILALMFTLMSLYMLTERAVTMFFLAGAIAFGAGYFIGECIHILDYFGKHLKKYKMHAKIGVFAIILLISFGFTAMVVPSSESFGFDVPPEWINLFEWTNQNLPQGSVITAWWDYGHWLSYYCGDNISVTTDNAQYAPSIYTTALAFTHSPACTQDSSTQEINCDSSPEALEQAEIESLSILKPMGTTHLLVDKEIVGGITGGKFGALTTIANKYLGCMQGLTCSKNDDGGAYCYFGKNSEGQDVGLTFTAEEWTQLKEEPWPGVALTGKGLPTRAFVREDTTGANIYMSALGCGSYFQPNANSPVLFAFLQRLFFEDENLKHVTLVYKDGWNVIYEIDWAGIPDPETSVLPDFEDNLKVINERLGE